jgi:hypothetical protein
MFTKDGICTLIDVIIDPTLANLLPQSCTTQEFVTFNAAQTKEMSYQDRHPTNQSLLFTTEVFRCLHRHVYVFLHDCANAIRSLKKSKSFHLPILITFVCQKISTTVLCKDASIFHLKLGNSHRPNYFLTSTTSTLLGHTYHHNQHVIDD